MTDNFIILFPVSAISWFLPDNKIHGTNVGPTWGRQDPGGPHVGHKNLAIWADCIPGKERISYGVLLL